MIGVSVTFRYGDFDERAMRKLAETARGRFEGMPGLRSKAFTLNAGKREAANFYVWDSEEAAKAFFTDEVLERIAGLYGDAPHHRVRADCRTRGKYPPVTWFRNDAQPAEALDPVVQRISPAFAGR